MKMKQFVTRLGLLALCVITPLAIAAESAKITNIEVSSVSADKQIVKVSFDGPPPTPTSFSVNTPPRIAFDFANTSNQAGKNSVQVNGAALRTINVAEGTGRTRLVFNLQKQAAYETSVDGNAYVITVDAAASGSAMASSSSSSKANTAQFSDNKVSSKRDGIQDIDFRRGNNGEGKVVIDLSSPNIPVDIRQQGKNLIVEFTKASLPKNLERRLDVTDFGTPIQKVETYTHGDSVKMTIEPKGQWEYSAYQTENRFVIEVRDEAANKDKTGAVKPNYKGEKLSLNFQSVEVRTVLQVIAEFTGLNIITSETVGGSLTLRLKDVPWDQALDIILQAKGLDQRKTGNVMWIAPRDELAAKEKAELESRKQISELEPTRTEYFQLKYHKAEYMKEILADEKQKILSPRGSAVISPRTNQVIVQDIPSKLEQIRDLLSKIDIPARQVMIEARIVEARDGFSRNLGVKWNALVAKDPDNRLSGGGDVNLPAAGATGTVNLLLSGASGLLNLELSAMEADGNGKIISSPRLVTADQTEAIIEDGQEVPFSSSSQNGATTTEFKKATLSLKVTPQITPEGNVLMDVQINKDSIGVITLNGPAINTKQIKTKVMVENGGTVVIGGIYTQDTSDDVSKIPLLGDIPAVGHLFRNTAKVNKKTEMLVFITPRVLTSDLTLR